MRGWRETGAREEMMEPRFESVRSDIDSSFRCLRFSCDSFSDDHAWHYHPEFELTWILRSEGTRFVGDSIQPYGVNDLVLVGPNLPHCWHNEPTMAGSGTPDLVVVQFQTGCFGTDFMELGAARSLRRFLSHAQQGIAFDTRTAARVGPLLTGMTEEHGLHRLARLLDVLVILAEAEDTVTLASRDYQLNNDITPVSRSRIEKVHRYIRENMADEISQAEIAAALGMSSPAFSRFFKAAMGQTFVNFVNILRINEACRLLSGDKPITEIAMECGYQNISNFNRQFLALRGLNPTEYRRQLRRRNNRILAFPKPADAPVLEGVS
jgi:AraC-like DNA-binding protein